MNKELEEAIKIFNELEIQDDTEFEKARQTILNYIKNSIPKDKIREKIGELEKQYEKILKENTIKEFILRQIEILKELLKK